MTLTVGKYNTLIVKEIKAAQVKLAALDGEEVSVKKALFREEPALGEHLDLFVYSDNDGKITVSPFQPNALAGEFAYMKVVSETKLGAFMDWGIEKDLLVPFSRQKERMREGMTYLIYVIADEETGRLVGTSKVDEYLQNDVMKLNDGDRVNLLICDTSDIGVNVIVNNKHRGLLYKNEIFKRIKRGDRTKGYIKKVREDGKLDVSLQEQGYDEVFKESLKVLGKLKEEGGFLPLNDKTEAATIYKVLQMSKKTFKKAIGALYKERKISIEDNGIRLSE
jgi:uncharacterized protein